MLGSLQEDPARDFLELASHQRLSIITRLLERRSKISTMARELESTSQEVSRNFERLEKANMITRGEDGYFHINSYGRAVCSMIPSLVFMTKNKDYFKKHDFGSTPQKFIRQIGSFVNGVHVKGFTRVLEHWNKIFRNANEYIYDIIYEEPLETIEPVVKRAKAGVKVKSLFSIPAIIPEGRRRLLKKLGFDALLEKNVVERRMRKGMTTVVLVSEKEGCVMFPRIDGEVDISQMFYSDDTSFQEWCLDYFHYYWDGAEIFQERKLRV